MSIRSADDYELLHHINWCLQGIRDTIRELNRRGQTVVILQDAGSDDYKVLTSAQWHAELKETRQ